jgi:hypothetical protein
VNLLAVQILISAASCLLAAFPIWLLVRSAKRGVLNGRGVDVYRSERPSAFWFAIVMYGVSAAVILSGGFYLAWFA